MKVKDFLDVAQGIKSIGIYKEKGDALEVEATVFNISKYADREIDYIDFVIYDESNGRDTNGELILTKRIRACIYVKEENYILTDFMGGHIK